ncbi:MAG TPA: hypothetical protein VG488_03265 [Candidatus Angelobacter sp.]|jgi:hypothetical protein|nr:hypothetical protein [Candidatus Angelobacter sp.]
MFQAKLKATFTLFIFMLALTAPAMLGHAAPAPPPPAVQSPDFTISVTPAFATRKRGSGEPYTITIQALNGFNGTVNFTVTGLFPGSSQFPVPPPPVTGSGTSGFDILTQHPPTTPQGTFTLTIIGTSGSLSHSQQVKLQMV